MQISENTCRTLLVGHIIEERRLYFACQFFICSPRFGYTLHLHQIWINTQTFCGSENVILSWKWKHSVFGRTWAVGRFSAETSKPNCCSMFAFRILATLINFRSSVFFLSHEKTPSTFWITDVMFSKIAYLFTSQVTNALIASSNFTIIVQHHFLGLRLSLWTMLRNKEQVLYQETTYNKSSLCWHTSLGHNFCSKTSTWTSEPCLIHYKLSVLLLWKRFFLIWYNGPVNGWVSWWIAVLTFNLSDEGLQCGFNFCWERFSTKKV